MDVSSASPQRSDPLPDRLQPSNENLVDDDEQSVAPVRIKSDQEPAIVDVQRAVIAKRGNAPVIPVNSPVGDSESNG